MDLLAFLIGLAFVLYLIWGAVQLVIIIVIAMVAYLIITAIWEKVNEWLKQ